MLVKQAMPQHHARPVQLASRLHRQAVSASLNATYVPLAMAALAALSVAAPTEHPMDRAVLLQQTAASLAPT